VISASAVPCQPIPATAPLVMRKLGMIDGAASAFDVNSMCLGFLTGMEVAARQIDAGAARHVLVCSSEIASPRPTLANRSRNGRSLWRRRGGGRLVPALAQEPRLQNCCCADAILPKGCCKLSVRMTLCPAPCRSRVTCSATGALAPVTRMVRPDIGTLSLLYRAVHARCRPLPQS